MADIELVIKIPKEMYAEIIDENGINTMLIPFSDIIRDCIPLPDGAEIPTKDAHSDLCTRVADVPNTNVGELISKQAVLGLKTIAPIAPVMNGEAVHYEEVVFVRDLEKLPSVEPERKPGKWIDISRDGDMGEFYCCSLCKREIILYPGETLKDYPYCHCGTKMKGGVNCNAED